MCRRRRRRRAYKRKYIQIRVPTCMNAKRQNIHKNPKKTVVTFEKKVVLHRLEAPQPQKNVLTRENISASYLLFRAVDSLRAPSLWVDLHFKRDSILPLLFAKSAKANARLKPTNTRRRRHNATTITTCDIAFLLERRAYTARI